MNSDDPYTLRLTSYMKQSKEINDSVVYPIELAGVNPSVKNLGNARLNDMDVEIV